MNKNLSVIIAVVAIAITVGIVFISQKMNTSFFNFNSPSSKTKLPANPSSQIRALNSILNEYNTYNNAAKQMNTGNNPL